MCRYQRGFQGHSQGLRTRVTAHAAVLVADPDDQNPWRGNKGTSGMKQGSWGTLQRSSVGADRMRLGRFRIGSVWMNSSPKGFFGLSSRSHQQTLGLLCILQELLSITFNGHVSKPVLDAKTPWFGGNRGDRVGCGRVPKGETRGTSAGNRGDAPGARGYRDGKMGEPRAAVPRQLGQMGERLTIGSPVS